ncbi:hypothetical protein PAECIP111893_01895 [Paenibacillus plantiphilus]|uniref:N-acetyltransferase domain-containing protein n=1 Tax=Paenibacillus plantiphilus TaxID=2905650 RepID=A0ABM9C524_9BACL|nr:GNAT family N-acetyltransferase [Paenibacillus plantiphilus]CAH1202710.1 hypothetical protein PAECIP111893_01895 [Paenibacillus plantiphilus]
MIINLQTGESHDVFFQQLTQKDLKLFQIFKNKGWVFDWRAPMVEGFEVFALCTHSQPKIAQGLIASRSNDKPECNFIEVANIESAPHNKYQHSERVFAGVGEHLMAYACKVSVQRGFDGFVQFKSKTTSIGFYEKIGAKHIGNLTMYFNEYGAATILQKCRV